MIIIPTPLVVITIVHIPSRWCPLKYLTHFAMSADRFWLFVATSMCYYTSYKVLPSTYTTIYLRDKLRLHFLNFMEFADWIIFQSHGNGIDISGKYHI